MTIRELYKIIEERRNGNDETSYTKSLFNDGADRIIQKVGEESVEVVIAAKNDDKDEFIAEASDIIYNLLVLFVEKDITVDNIEQKLQRRYDDRQ